MIFYYITLFMLVDLVTLQGPPGLPAEDPLSDCDVAKHCTSCIGMASLQSFRTFDGTCNNLNNLMQGASLTKLRRFVAAQYCDGSVDYPRGFPGTAPILPTSHEVAREVFQAIEPEEGNKEETSILFMTWGQFIDHDITLSRHASSSTCPNPTCNIGDFTKFKYPCFPMSITSTASGCTKFVRSKAACVLAGDSPVREQINTLSSYIDGSMIYGPDVTVAEKLRKLDGYGQLRTHTGDLLPIDTESQEPCAAKGGCFLAGDIRVNENIALASMHTLWIREHNRIALQLESINQFWSETRIYQEARKIVVAMIQHITYNEFLPLLYNVPKYSGYQDNIDSSIANGFANAAYRFGHSLIPNSFPQVDVSFNQIHNNIPLREAFFDNQPLLHNGIERTLLGIVSNESKAVDTRFAHTLVRSLFVPLGDPSLMDLSAINIHRGRDHGLPPYLKWREFCNLPKVESFNDLHNHFPADIVTSFQNIYLSVDDIELYPAGLAENKDTNNILGPTFKCIIKKQFENIRSGDRYYFENPGVFTQDQYKSIKKVTMKQIYCNNLLNIVSLQDKPFHAFNGQRQRTNCNYDDISDDSTSVNLLLWRELPV